jgi:site-specific DNA-methyltransferase (adenine-specific)
MSEYILHLGDCLEYIKTMSEDSIDSIVTDPPYHLKSIVKRFGKPDSTPAQFGSDGAYSRHSTGFMGKEWDGGDIAHDPKTWEACVRVAKPGAFLLAFGGTRTFHRLACAIEDAGWEIRDCVMWVYGSGFPKSHNLKGEWQGWGTALKPAWEPIIVARKPVEGSVAENVLEYGAGALNIDASRVEGEPVPINKLEEWSGFGQKIKPDYEQEINTKGRWPANLIHDGSEEVLELFPPGRSAGLYSKGNHNGMNKDAGSANIPLDGLLSPQYSDSGSAARFFYCAKASKEDRDEGCKDLPVSAWPTLGDGIGGQPNQQRENNHNNHPTVKPTALMRYLCRLVTQPGGKIFDPFMGSGSTGKAAMLEGFNFVGCDTESDYVEIAKKRIEAAASQMIMPLEISHVQE